MAGKTIMIQGTSSDAGKSMLVTALCRIFKRRGVRVCPFKPQNMALNSAVTADGGEIGRAQAVQAMACGLEPAIDMNPILLKPNSNTGAQVIVHGKPLTNMDARTYHENKPRFLPYALESHKRLQALYDLIIVEGAGSPAEINLRGGDIANMGFAEAADCPVILVADIERGGVFAQIVGTMEILSQAERARVKGFIINRFRGDVSILKPGLDWLEERTGKPVLGVIPFMQQLYLEAEDSLSRPPQPASQADSVKLKVIAPRLPRSSNLTDFDALILHPQVDFQLVAEGTTPPLADLIILPGSKNVHGDFAWLERTGWVEAIKRHLRYGGKLLGICGGFQMLGKTIADPHGIESDVAAFSGMGFLDMETVLEEHKQLRQVAGTLTINDVPVRGYEIHMGVSKGPALLSPFVLLGTRPDGAVSPDGQIAGTYLHGIFDEKEACAAILSWAGLVNAQQNDFPQERLRNIDAIANLVEQNIDLKALEAFIALSPAPANSVKTS